MQNTTSPRALRRWLLAAPLAALLLLAISVTLPGAIPEAHAQGAKAKASKDTDPYVALIRRANTSYNAEKYGDAIRLYTDAIQLAPGRPDAYRNLARSYFWAGRYAGAVAHYDIYLVHFPSTKDREQIQKERKLASARARAPWVQPTAQREALIKLETLLEKGQPAYRKTGPCAWLAYGTLLRSGYAHPNLQKLRGRLAAQLIDEHTTRLKLAPDQMTPALTLDDWKEQRDRLKRAREVAPDATALARIDRLMLIDDAAIELMLSHYLKAAQLTQTAAKANPDALFLWWYRISALMHANRTREAIDTLELLRPKLANHAPRLLPKARVMRAILLQQTGEASKAADLYIQALTSAP